MATVFKKLREDNTEGLETLITTLSFVETGLKIKLILYAKGYSRPTSIPLELTKASLLVEMFVERLKVARDYERLASTLQNFFSGPTLFFLQLFCSHKGYHCNTPAYSLQFLQDI